MRPLRNARKTSTESCRKKNHSNGLSADAFRYWGYLWRWLHAWQGVRADSKLKGSGRSERRLELIGQGSLVAPDIGNDDDDDDYGFRSRLHGYSDVEVILLRI